MSNFRDNFLLTSGAILVTLASSMLFLNGCNTNTKDSSSSDFSSSVEMLDRTIILAQIAEDFKENPMTETVSFQDTSGNTNSVQIIGKIDKEKIAQLPTHPNNQIKADYLIFVSRSVAICESDEWVHCNAHDIYDTIEVVEIIWLEDTIQGVSYGTLGFVYNKIFEQRASIYHDNTGTYWMEARNAREYGWTESKEGSISFQ